MESVQFPIKLPLALSTHVYRCPDFYMYTYVCTFVYMYPTPQSGKCVFILQSKYGGSLLETHVT